MTEKQQAEVLPIIAGVDFRFKYPAGVYMSKCLHEMKENARFLGIQCPKCKAIWWPPQVVCSYCHSETGTNWVELGPRGTVINWVVVHIPAIDPRTGEVKATQPPAATIRLDGPEGRGANWLHFLEETDLDKIKKGMRVEAVFKPKEEREGQASDVMFFRTVEE